MVINVDDELIQEGVVPFQRPMAAHMKIRQRLKMSNLSIFYIFDDPLFIAIKNVYDDLYRQTDLEMPLMHTGAFMFRDVFFMLRIPIVFGRPMVDVVGLLIDATDRQKQWLFSNQESGLTYFDQVIDLMDFSYGLDDIEKREQLPAKTLEWWFMAKQQLEAAAATALGSFDKYAVIQNCCISTELLLKGALMATVKGITEKILSDNKQGYGHNLENLVTKLAQELPDIDEETMHFVVKQFPNYVKSRYEAQKFSRIELGRFLMNAQFIGGEIMRQFSARNFRANLNLIPDGNWDISQRTFPKKLKE